jgi:hypothetical protein
MAAAISFSQKAKRASIQSLSTKFLFKARDQNTIIQVTIASFNMLASVRGTMPRHSTRRVS